MAFQGYRSKKDFTTGENRGSPARVAGKPPMKYKDGLENLTPPPTKPVETPDHARSTSWGRSDGNPRTGNPGQQGYGGSSSTRPGEAPAPATIKATAPVDAVLDSLIRETGEPKPSALGGDSWQTRSAAYADAEPYPTTPGTRKRGPADGSPGTNTIPAKTGFTVFNPANVRKP
jgi:hypothetical protein